jgi:RNA polymerase sigma-70 factor (ECF subfamily)
MTCPHTVACVESEPASSDEALLLRVGADDDEFALETLYTRHLRSAVALANRLLVDPQEAEDVVHDVFVTLRCRPHHFDPDRGGGRSWLMTVVRNRTLDRLRRRVPSRDIDDLADQLPDPEAVSPLAEMDAAARRELLWRSVGCLPASQRALILRCFVEGQSHHEIARQTGLPLGTVKSRIRLGLEKLRAALAVESAFTMAGA